MGFFIDMATGKRDENHIVVLMGVSSVDLTTPIPFTVDPDTGRLRVKFVGDSGNSATPDRNKARRDENREPVLVGENNTTEAIEPFSIETANDGWMLKRT